MKIFIYQHENTEGEKRSIIPAIETGGGNGNAGIEKGHATINQSLGSLAKFEQHEVTTETHDKFDGNSEKAVLAKFKAAKCDSTEYNIVKLPFLSAWIAKKKASAGGLDISKDTYQGKEDIVKYNILASGREITDYDIKNIPMLGLFVATRK